MKTKLVLTVLSLILAGEANAINLKVGDSANKTRAVVTQLSNSISQSLKLQELLSLSTDQFKRRMPEVLEVLQAYEFSKRSIREREVQIREYLRLAVKATSYDDSLEADEYVYNAYTEYRSDFDMIIHDITFGRYRDEPLTASQMTKLQCRLAGMQATRREGNDAQSVTRCK